MNHPSNQNAFSWLDLLLIVAAAAGIILVILPQIARHHAPASRINCAYNLKQIGVSSLVWAGDNNDQFPMQVSVTNGGAMELAERGSAYAVFLVMSNELNTPKILVCPRESNPKRVAAWTFDASVPPAAANRTPLFTPTNNLSYFVGLDADATAPTTILSGDDNFSVNKQRPNPGLFLLQTNQPVTWTKDRHVNQGYVGLADGSVQNFTTLGFRVALAKTGIATNRLAMP
jgi:hypothetical protein